MISANVSVDVMNILSNKTSDPAKKDVSYAKDTSSQKHDFKSVLENANKKIEYQKPKVKNDDQENKVNVQKRSSADTKKDVTESNGQQVENQDNGNVQKVQENSQNNAQNNAQNNTENNIQNNTQGNTESSDNKELSSNEVNVSQTNETSETNVQQNINLSEEDKKFVEDLANELNIDPESLMNFIQTFNINLDNINKSDIGKAAEQLKGLVENLVSKISVKLNLKVQDLPFKEKMHLMLKLKTNNLGKDNVGVDSVNLKLNLSVDDKDKKMNNAQTDDVSQKEQVDKPTDIQVKAKVLVKQTEPNIDQQSVNEVENEAQSIQTKGKEFSGESKNSFTQLFQGAKVINLKTKNDANIEGIRQDLFQMVNTKNGIENLVPKETLQVLNNIKDNVFSQILDNTKLILSDNQTEMELNLKPENLGKLNLKIASENGAIVAKIVADNQQVRDIIESNLIQLKESLKEQGLNIQDVSVSVGNDRRQQFENSNIGKGRGTRRISFDSNDVIKVSDNYLASQQISNNPYLASESSFDYSA